MLPECGKFDTSAFGARPEPRRLSKAPRCWCSDVGDVVGSPGPASGPVRCKRGFLPLWVRFLPPAGPGPQPAAAVRLSTLLYYHSATNPLILNLLGPDKPTVRFVIRINKIRLADHETRANPLE